MTKTFMALSVTTLLLVGCREKENTTRLKAINETLEFSGGVIMDEIKLACGEMREKGKDPQTAILVERWMPRQVSIQKAADSIWLFIDELKKKLVRESDSLQKSNATIVKDLCKQNGIGYSLIHKMMAFKDSLPVFFHIPYSIDSSYEFVGLRRYLQFIEKATPLLTGYSDNLSDGQKSAYAQQWIADNFQDCSPLMALVVLNKMENDLVTIEKELLQYCNSKIAYGCVLNYDKFFAIAVANSNYIKLGQSIDVTAGVGSFSEAAKPTITINGEKVKLNDDAVAAYHFTPVGKPGAHRVKVKIEFTKPDGTTAEVHKEIKYTIAE